MTSISPHSVDIKKALRRSDLAISFIPAKYSFSPYRACEHACLYCDGRAEKYYVEGDFERDIVVRRNLPEVLADELGRLREPGIVSVGSGVSDPYQPIEREEMLMARCCAVLDQHSIPAALLTKSSLPMRDIETWSNVARAKQFTLAVSLTTLDDSLRGIFEPRASPVQERVAMLRAYKARGCTVGVLAMPLLPGITDTTENVDELYRELAAIDVDFVMPGGLTLRPGVQKETFMRCLHGARPDLVELYNRIYRENRLSGAPHAEYYRPLQARLVRQAAASGLVAEAPHGLYRGMLTLYDEVHVLLCHMVTLYMARGIDAGRLRRSLSRYVEWFMVHKREFNRRRSMSYRRLEEVLREACRSGTIADILDNRKLAGFVRRVVLDRAVFDYRTLRLSDCTNARGDGQVS